MTPGDGLLFYKVERGYAADESMYVAMGKIDQSSRQMNTRLKSCLERLLPNWCLRSWILKKFRNPYLR